MGKLTIALLTATFAFTSLFSQNIENAKKLYGEPVKPQNADIYYGKKPRIYLHDYWRFKFIDGKPGYSFSGEEIKSGFQKPEFDDSSWELRPVPKKIFCWPGRTKEPNLLQKEGIGYLRYSITIPEKYKEKRAILHFERVSWEPIIWVNGKELARPKNLIPGKCADSHSIDITDAINWGKRNVIAVRFYIKKTKRGYYECQNTNGIWGQSAYIEFVPPVYCSEMRITPILPDKANVKAAIINTYKTDKKIDLKATASPWKGKGVQSESEKAINLKPGKNEVELSVKIKNAILWDIDNPFLYSMKLFNGSEEIGWERFGLREIKVKNNNFYLNGHKLFLSGPGAEPSDIFCVLQHSNKASDFWRNQNNFLRKYLETLKESNCNAMLKTERIPPQMFLNILDELGMVSIPSPDLLVECHYSDYGKELLKKDRTAFLEEGMRRNTLAAYNHPSLIAYAPEAEGNRVPGAVSDSHAYRKILEKYDKTRLLTASQSGMSAAKNLKNELEPLIPPPAWDFVNSAALMGSCSIWMHHTFIPDELRHNAKEQDARWNFGKQKPYIYTEALYYYGWRAHTQYWSDILKKYGKVLENGKLNKKLYCDLYGKGVPKDKPHLEFHYKDISRVGIRNAFDKKNKLHPRLAEYTGEMIELARMNDDCIQGFGSCGGPMVGIKEGKSFQDLNPKDIIPNEYNKIYRKTCAPIFICADLLCKHNLFAGREYTTQIHCFNYTKEDLKDASIKIKILDKDGEKAFLRDLKLNTLKKDEHRVLNFNYALPENLKTGNYKMRFELCADDKTLSKNSYDLFILSQKDENMKIKTKKRVAVIGHGSRLMYGFSVCRALTRLGVKYDYFSKARGFEPDKYDLVVVDKEGGSWGGDRVVNFLKKGGRVVCLEQDKKISFLPAAIIEQAGTHYGLQRKWGDEGRIGISGDLIEPEHPVFKKINRPGDWRHWTDPHGKLFTYLIFPLSEGVLLAGSDNGMKQRKTRKMTKFGMLIAEIKVGDGIALLSQVDAIDAYGFDSVATKYIHNLFGYALSDKWNGKYAATLRKDSNK